MSNLRPKTDRTLVTDSSEFLWDIDSSTEIHRFVSAPILRKLKNAGAERVLDIGCGNGSFTAFLHHNGYNVCGLDHSHSGISLAREHFPSIPFDQFDVQSPLQEKHHSRYDAVVSVEVIEHLLLPRKLVENARLALKPGGLFILTTPFHGYWKNLALALTNQYDDHWHPLRDFGHVKFFSRRTILSLFGEYHFNDVRFETVGRIPTLARSMMVDGIKPA